MDVEKLGDGVTPNGEVSDALSPPPQPTPAFENTVCTIRDVWAAHEANPCFFRRLEIAHDGGLSSVDGLFQRSRFAQAAMTVAGVCVNVWFLIQPNLMTLTTMSEWIVPKSAANSPTIINRVGCSSCEHELHPAVLVAMLELLLVTVLLLLSLAYVFRSVWFASTDQTSRWDAVSTLLLELVPELGSMSAMRLLNYITPSIFVPALTVQIKGVVKRKGRLFGVPLFLFCVKRITAGVIGFDTFLVKFHAVSVQVDEGTIWEYLLRSLAFLNQVLGVVQVARYARWRLLVYIFGGKDCYIDRNEAIRQRVWHSMLAQKVWTAAKTRRFSFAWFCAVMLSYSDFDFQVLTLNELAKRRPKELES